MADRVILDSVSFVYPDGTQALRSISTSFGSCSVTALLGPTGSGKTTLLMGLAGILQRHHSRGIAGGSVTIGPERFNPFPLDIQIPRIGLVTQEPWTFISGMRETVREEILFAFENLGFPPESASERTEEVLHELELIHLAERTPLSLSGGELQRVAIASIAALRPTLLLLDEPTHSLDGRTRTRLALYLRKLAKETTIVVADDDIEFSLIAADRFLVLDNGGMAFEGSRSEFLDHLGMLSSLLPVGSWPTNRALAAGKTVQHHLSRWMQRFGEG